MTTSTEIVVDCDGSLRCLYDELIDLHSLGAMNIERGSHVEPGTDGRWTADLSPVSGPTLGPFTHRTEALAAERDWLQRHWLASTH